MQEKQDKELQQFQNRLRDLAQKSYGQNVYTFTEFLGLGEQDIFWRMESELQYAGIKVWGGRNRADRVMVRFGSPEAFGYEADFPLACIHICPNSQKFAQELSHRDFLGALMNLGIQRGTLGDILVGEKEAFLFCQEGMTEDICRELTQVRHTPVTCREVEEPGEVAEEAPEVRLLQVASARADAVLAKVYNLSREKSLELFRAGKVFIGGRLCENNARTLKPGETVNARGSGKFLFVGEKGETRKGRTNVEVAVYR